MISGFFIRSLPLPLSVANTRMTGLEFSRLHPQLGSWPVQSGLATSLCQPEPDEMMSTMTSQHSCYLCSQRRVLLQGAALWLTLPGTGVLEASAREGWTWVATRCSPNWCLRRRSEKSAAQQHAQQAAAKNALAGKDHPQVRRLRAIAQKSFPTLWAGTPEPPIGVGR